MSLYSSPLFQQPKGTKARVTILVCLFVYAEENPNKGL